MTRENRQTNEIVWEVRHVSTSLIRNVREQNARMVRTFRAKEDSLLQWNLVIRKAVYRNVT
jgi:hypothetical protein